MKIIWIISNFSLQQRIPNETLSGLASALADGPIFEIVDGLTEVQQAVEKQLFRQRLEMLKRHSGNVYNNILFNLFKHRWTYVWSNKSFIYRLFILLSNKCILNNNFQIFFLQTRSLRFLLTTSRRFVASLINRRYLEWRPSSTENEMRWSTNIRFN